MQWLFFQKMVQKNLLQKFEAAIEGLDDFLVFADLLGGTPCQRGRSFDPGRT